jgi:glycosyltransferase involved in cell wall biosynthesis
MVFSVGLDRSALDPTFKAHAGRGIGRYVQELTRFFDSCSPGDLRVGGFDYRSFALPKPLDLSLRNLPLGRQTIRQQIFYPLQLAGKRLNEFHALHFPAHMDAPSWSGKPVLITVLDLIPLILRSLYEADRPGPRFRFARWLENRAIRNATLVLAISECTARDVHRILGVPLERIVVTPLGVDDRFFINAHEPRDLERVNQTLDLPPSAPVLLYVGGIDQRKNIEGVLGIYERVHHGCRERGVADLPMLVMAGKIEGDRRYPWLLEEIRSRRLCDRVRLPGYVPDDALLSLYRRSSVFVFPSLYEGFGLPPLEALAAGVPVVCSNTSSLPEVVGDAAVMVCPHDLDTAAREVLSLLFDRDRAVSLARGGPLQARKFRWSKTGELTLGAYERAARILAQ